MTVYFHEGDLPDGLDLGLSVAVDSETMGLRYHRDPLCVVQLSAGAGCGSGVGVSWTPQEHSSRTASSRSKHFLMWFTVIASFSVR